jgi:hypothetical protein
MKQKSWYGVQRGTANNGGVRSFPLLMTLEGGQVDCPLTLSRSIFHRERLLFPFRAWKTLVSCSAGAVEADVTTLWFLFGLTAGYSKSRPRLTTRAI